MGKRVDESKAVQQCIGILGDHIAWADLVPLTNLLTLSSSQELRYVSFLERDASREYD